MLEALLALIIAALLVGQHYERGRWDDERKRLIEKLTGAPMRDTSAPPESVVRAYGDEWEFEVEQERRKGLHHDDL